MVDDFCVFWRLPLLSKLVGEFSHELGVQLHREEQGIDRKTAEDAASTMVLMLLG